MKISLVDKDNIAIIEPLATLDQFVNDLHIKCNDNLGKHNLVVNLTEKTQELQSFDLDIFEELAVRHMEERNKSFVLVLPEADFNEFDQDLIVVRTLQEAFDLIEMDEIQRDLEFN